MATIEINGYEFKLLRNCKKAMELLEIYKNRPARESFPCDVLDTSSYCMNGVWLYHHQWVREYHRALEEMRADLKAKRTRMIKWDDHAYSIGFTVEHDGTKYLAIADFGLYQMCGGALLIKMD